MNFTVFVRRGFYIAINCDMKEKNLQNGGLRTHTVWPDVAIKVAQFFSKVAQKVSATFFLKKWHFQK